MSFVDTVGPFVLCILLGSAGVIAALAWIFIYLVPRAREARARTSVTRNTVLYNAKARQFVDEVIAENSSTNLIPDRIMRQAWALRDLADDNRRGIQ